MDGVVRTTFRVFDHLGRAALHHRHAGVGCAEVNADCLAGSGVSDGPPIEIAFSCAKLTNVRAAISRPHSFVGRT